MATSPTALAKHYSTSLSKFVRRTVASALYPLGLALDRRSVIVPKALVEISQKNLSLDQSNDTISTAIESEMPFSASRFGRSELLVTVQQLQHDWPLPKRVLSSLITGDSLSWRASESAHLWISGFYPYWIQGALFDFSRCIRGSAQNIDLLGSWVKGENLVPEIPKDVTVTDLPNLEPFFSQRPWTLALEGKRVLVIHPFADSIKAQYAKRTQVHRERHLLPNFDLEAIVPPVTRVSPREIPHMPSSSWFDHLAQLEAQVATREFDVAIIGAGSYGMPIASRIKDMGKISVNLGGATQLLFGIWGQRWNGQGRFEALRNESWVRPSGDEVPVNAGEIEDAAYW